MPKEHEFKITDAVEGVFRRATELTDLTNYYGLFTLYAAARHAKLNGNVEMLEKVKSYIDLYPDKINHPPYSFAFNEIGSVAKAYLNFTGDYNDKEEIRKYAEITYNNPRSDDGILCHHNTSDGKYVWVDSVGYFVPFMLYAGLCLNEAKYYDFAAEQAVKIYDALVDETCGLVHHSRGGFGKEEPMRKTEDHWSRGNGWMTVGLSTLLEYLPKTSQFYDAVKERYLRMMSALLGRQSMRGLWKQDIINVEAWEESSGTALFTYAIGVGLRLGVLTDEAYKTAFNNALWAICSHCITESYNTYHCCEGVTIPHYDGKWGTADAYLLSVRSFRNEPHSFGTFIMALSEALLNGATTVMRLDRLGYAGYTQLNGPDEK